MGRVRIERPAGAEMPFVVGSYIGDNADSTPRTINLGATPKLVILYGNESNDRKNVTIYWATTFSVLYETYNNLRHDSGSAYIKIVQGGFTVSHQGINWIGVPYTYIALL